MLMMAPKTSSLESATHEWKVFFSFLFFYEIAFAVLRNMCSGTRIKLQNTCVSPLFSRPIFGGNKRTKKCCACAKEYRKSISCNTLNVTTKRCRISPENISFIFVYEITLRFVFFVENSQTCFQFIFLGRNVLSHYLKIAKISKICFTNLTRTQPKLSINNDTY